MLDITDEVVDRATEIRAQLGLKTPDAIHAASAVVASADMLLTGDEDMTRIVGPRVELADATGA